MFNRNGSNNGNGYGVHKDTALVVQNDPASSVGQELLLWDGLSPAVANSLGQPLDPALVSHRKGRAGRTYDYLEGHAVIDQANRIFGYGGWGFELVENVTLRQFETVNPQTGEIKTACAYSAPVRVTVPGAPPRTDVGFHSVTEENAEGHDTAMKGAVTDGMKRALRSFGIQFGNGFYGDQPTVSRPPPLGARPRSNRGQVRPGAGQPWQSRTLGDAAQAAHGAGRRAGLRREPGADRRGGQDGQEPRRLDGGGDGSPGGGRSREAPGDAAGAVDLVRPAHRDTE